MDSTNAYIRGPSSTPIEQVNLATGTIRYLVGDLLGSVRGVVSSAGALTASTAYDAWGNPETTGGLTAYTPLGLAGGYIDPTGLTYLIHRYYDPQTGQFITVDPFVDQTEQPYGYAGQDPINAYDLAGTDTTYPLTSQAGLGLAILLGGAADVCIKSGACSVKKLKLPHFGSTSTSAVPNVVYAKGGKQNVIPTAAEGVQSPSDLDALVESGAITAQQRVAVEKAKGWRRSGQSGNKKKPKQE
jgi:RHS repeat-associated protein